MDTARHIEMLERESHAFGRMIVDADIAAPVPSCPGWTIADLVWHLTSVQHFWGAIAENLLEDPSEVSEADRVDDALLAIAFQSASHRLIEAVRRHPPTARCWTWDDDEGTIGWVARRQHHEAAIHRVDLEQATGVDAVLDDESALDGIDEMIDVQLDGFPEWGRFESGRIVEIAPVGSHSRFVDVGEFFGSSPTTGTSYDGPAARRATPGPAEAKVSGPAPIIDMWMWGRTGIDRLDVTGDEKLVAQLRSVIATETG